MLEVIIIIDEQLTPDHTVEIDLPKVAKNSLYLTLLPLVFLISIHFMLQGQFLIKVTFGSIITLVVGYVIFIILHEFFHLFGLRVFAKVPWKSMKVGVNFKLGIAYATTDKLMTNRAVRKALLLPFWMTGILPALVGLYIESGVLITISALLIGGAAGDFAMYNQLKKLPDHWLIKDDPKLPKLYVYDPKRIQL